MDAGRDVSAETAAGSMMGHLLFGYTPDWETRDARPTGGRVPDRLRADAHPARHDKAGGHTPPVKRNVTYVVRQQGQCRTVRLDCGHVRMTWSTANRLDCRTCPRT